MNKNKALEVMLTEKCCVERQGDISKCDRRCGECDLLLPTEEVLQAYDFVINMLTENTGDLISRGALINTLKELEWITDDMENDTASIEDIINDEPTVEYPEQIIIKCDTEEDKQKLLSALRNARVTGFVENERPTGEWISIEKEDDLIDHYWYIVAHEDYKTPIKAKYHTDVPHFTFSANGEEHTSYIFEGKITHYMDLPELPKEAENGSNN